MNYKSKTITNKSILFGVFGSFMLIATYIAILSIANSFEHAITQFYEMWYWFVLLSIGFGTQIGLYTYAKNFAKANDVMAATMGASGGVSTVSMAACCAHHITDFLPILGLSAAAIFLTKYQEFFIIFGIVSNITGIIFMLKTIQQHNLYYKNGTLKYIMSYDLKKTLKITVFLGIIILAIKYRTII